MIVPTGGVAFTLAADGDARSDLSARRTDRRRPRHHQRVGSDPPGARVRRWSRSTEPGDHGEADALFTLTDVPVAVFTADCLALFSRVDGGVGVAHAGWRGAEAGVVPELRRRMDRAGVTVDQAFIGPGIGACCFEVGPEVAERFGGFIGTTTWGTASVDLVAVIRAAARGVEVWSARAVHDAPARASLAPCDGHTRPNGGVGVAGARLSRRIMTYSEVMNRVSVAAARVGRSPADVRVVVVSKGRTVEQIAAVYEQGHREFAENRAAGAGGEDPRTAR